MDPRAPPESVCFGCKLKLQMVDEAFEDINTLLTENERLTLENERLRNELAGPASEAEGDNARYGTALEDAHARSTTG